jgi:hypothetical protein
MSTRLPSPLTVDKSNCSEEKIANVIKSEQQRCCLVVPDATINKDDIIDEDDTISNNDSMENYEDDGNDDDDDDNDYNCSSNDFLNDEDQVDDADDDEDENNIYLNDPEHFEFECFSLEKIDSIMEKKCDNIMKHLNLSSALDALFLLEKFNWNAQRCIEIFDKDKQLFLQSYLSDNNNNNKTTTTTSILLTNKCSSNIQMDRNHVTKLSNYVNIFSNQSKLFENMFANDWNGFEFGKTIANVTEATKQQLKNLFCEICCVNMLNVELDMAAALGF